MVVKKKYHDKNHLDISVTLRADLYEERKMLERLASVLSDGATEVKIVCEFGKWQVKAVRAL